MRCGSYEARATQTQDSISSSDSQLQLSRRVDWPYWTLGCGIIPSPRCVHVTGEQDRRSLWKSRWLLLKSIYLLRPCSIWASSQKHSSPDPCHRTNFLLLLFYGHGSCTMSWDLERKTGRRERGGEREILFMYSQTPRLCVKMSSSHACKRKVQALLHP